MDNIYFEVFIIGLLGVMSPGPDFLIVVKNALNSGRVVGFGAVSGVCCALIVHITYTVVGINLFQKNLLLFACIQIAGSLYLLYLAKNLFFKGITLSNETERAKVKDRKFFLNGFKEGFICNILNPKAAAYFISIFSQFLSSEMTVLIKYALGLIVISTALIWFGAVVIFISQKSFYKAYVKYHIIIERLLGIFLVYISLKIILNIIL